MMSFICVLMHTVDTKTKCSFTLKHMLKYVHTHRHTRRGSHGRNLLMRMGIPPSLCCHPFVCISATSCRRKNKVDVLSFILSSCWSVAACRADKHKVTSHNYFTHCVLLRRTLHRLLLFSIRVSLI